MLGNISLLKLRGRAILQVRVGSPLGSSPRFAAARTAPAVAPPSQWRVSTVALVNVKNYTQIDSVDTAIIGQHKALRAEPGLDTFDAAARWRIEGSWYQIDLQIVDRASMLLDCTSAEIGRHGTIVSRIVGETAFVNIPLKTQHQAELAVILALHDVPKYRPAVDLGHLFRPSLGVLNQTDTGPPLRE